MAINLAPIPDIEKFCQQGLDIGRKVGKPHDLKDSRDDLIWEAAYEARDGVNYTTGKLDQVPSRKVGLHVGNARNYFELALRELQMAKRAEIEEAEGDKNATS